MSSIVSTDIHFLVLPPSPPAEKATACQTSTPAFEERRLRHTITRWGALAASCIAAAYIQQRRPVPHVSGQINGLRHKASITARGASDHKPSQVVLQTMACHPAHHMPNHS